MRQYAVLIFSGFPRKGISNPVSDIFYFLKLEVTSYNSFKNITNANSLRERNTTLIS